MDMIEGLKQEFAQEMSTARKLISSVNDAQLGWKPHQKSMSFGELCQHLVDIPSWAEAILRDREYDVASDTGPAQPTSTKVLLENLDRNVARAISLIESTPAAAMGDAWSLKNGKATVFTLPRVAVARTFLLSHMIHHRGQLSVYLRLNGIPVPSIYGPSADEPM